MYASTYECRTDERWINKRAEKNIGKRQNQTENRNNNKQQR